MLIYCYVINVNTSEIMVKHKNVLNYKYCEVYKCIMNELLYLCGCGYNVNGSVTRSKFFAQNVSLLF